MGTAVAWAPPGHPVEAEPPLLAARIEPAPDVGVGPHPRPWPDDAHLDPELLEAGDRRNVVDRYRYWRVEAIMAAGLVRSLVRTCHAQAVAGNPDPPVRPEVLRSARWRAARDGLSDRDARLLRPV